MKQPTSLSFFLILCLCLMSAGCAAHRAVSSDEIARGHLGTTTWKDCKLSKGASQVVCKCQVFDVSMDAKTGSSVLRCTKTEAQ